jgi:tRNA-Thr(GGU) m(6)t(6)A37 methyltransferase TsaA
MTGEFGFRPIGIIRSCFTGRFGIPRQPRLVPAATARLELFPEYARDEAFSALEGFSHLWLIYVFHDCVGAGWKPTVRPPRLGGRGKVGVFASRAPYRPNPIGMSAVEYLGSERRGSGFQLRLGGVDLLDATPVLDVKPYVPYADTIPEARVGYAPAPPGKDWDVEFTDAAARSISAFDPNGARRLRSLITQVLRQDPRPGYMERYPERRDFGMRLFDLDVRWRIDGGRVRVISIERSVPAVQ